MKAIVRFLVRMLVLNIVLLPLMVLGPLFYVIPFFCIAANPQDNFSGLAQLYFWLGPLSCAFWMLLSCHWPTVHRARLEGRLSTWRETEGGIARTVTKATVYMFAGLFGSFFFEVGLMFLLLLLRGNRHRTVLWFALLPFATYAPVILLWLRRWIRGRKRGDFIGRSNNDRELRDQLRAASLYAKKLRSKEAY
jgi:hypothetical protein